MSDPMAQILSRLNDLDEKVDGIDRHLAEMRGERRIQCANHERRIIAVETRQTGSVRFWGALLSIIAVISATIAAAIAALMR